MTRTVLFLCTGNYYRSRFAEALFNALARREGLSWLAESRGLALERGVNNVGPISADTVEALARLGFPLEAAPRLPWPVGEGDFRRADLVIAVKGEEHRPLLLDRHPAWVEVVEYWDVHDVDFAPAREALPALEARVRALIRRLRRAG